MGKPLILVTNDDGITSKGIKHLVEWMATLGDVVVVAPRDPQSGMGHAITVNDTIRLEPSDVYKDPVEAYYCTGTPADCVKLAKYHLFQGKKPDLVVSGINHGSNSSISVLYSGTMSAAIEGAVEGIPSIGFSLCDWDLDADFSHCEVPVKEIASKVLEEGLADGVALNVNIPSKSAGPLKGLRICRQARAKWYEKFDERKDPYGRRYFWMTGEFVNHDGQDDVDEWALANNYVSVVPCMFDLTAHNVILEMKGWEIENGDKESKV